METMLIESARIINKAGYTATTKHITGIWAELVFEKQVGSRFYLFQIYR